MTTMRRAAVAMAAVTALSVAVWAVVDGPATTATRPPVTPSPVRGRVVVLDNGSEGSSIMSRLGSLVRVELTGRDAMHWSTILASPPVGVLLRRSASQSSNGSSRAVFTAIGDGRATLTSTGAPVCAPDSACPQYLVLWRVSVVVGG